MIYDVESYNCDITIILVKHISHISPMYVIYPTVILHDITNRTITMNVK